MSKKKSRFSTSDSEGYSWAKIQKFAVTTRRYRSRKTWRKIDQQRALNRVKDRRRQGLEANLNWDFVRLLLDANKGLTLAEAKLICEELQTL